MQNRVINIPANPIQLKVSLSITAGIVIWIATGGMTTALTQVSLVKIYMDPMGTLGMADLDMVMAAGDMNL